MTTLPRTIPGHHARGRQAAAAVATVALSLGLTACGDSAGPEEGVTAGDLQDMEDRMNELEDRVAVVEEDGVGLAPEDSGDLGSDLWTDPEGLLGEEVTVSAEVTEILGANKANIAFRIAEPGADAIAVISRDGPSILREEDVVQVTGTVTLLEESSFEDDFGVTADGVLQDADAFFEDTEGQVVLKASELEVLEEDS